jgi:hypothetical protein
MLEHPPRADMLVPPACLIATSRAQELSVPTDACQYAGAVHGYLPIRFQVRLIAITLHLRVCNRWRVIMLTRLFRFSRGNGDSEGQVGYSNWADDLNDIDSVVKHFEQQGYQIYALIGHSRGMECTRFSVRCRRSSHPLHVG